MRTTALVRNGVVAACVALSMVSLARGDTPFRGRCDAFVYGGDADLSNLYRAETAGDMVRVETSVLSAGDSRVIQLPVSAADEQSATMTMTENFLQTTRGFAWLFGGSLVSFDLRTRELASREMEKIYSNTPSIETQTAGMKHGLTGQPKLVVYKDTWLAGVHAWKQVFHLRVDDARLYIDDVPFDVSEVIGDEGGRPTYAISSDRRLYWSRNGKWTEIAGFPVDRWRGLAIFPDYAAGHGAVLLSYNSTANGLTWSPKGKVSQGVYVAEEPADWPRKSEVVDFALDPHSGAMLWFIVKSEDGKRKIVTKHKGLEAEATKWLSSGRRVSLLESAVDSSAVLIGVLGRDSSAVYRVQLSGLSAGSIQTVCE